jgi:hypothetical protein
MPTKRTRLALALLSLATIGLELALMRLLSLRFWHHFAYMVISVALLGFGASGTLLILLRPLVARARALWLAGACLGFAVSIPLVLWGARHVPLNVQLLAWSWSQAGNVGALELLMLAPFLFAGAGVCVALTDRADRVGGHYGANLAGSGAGAFAAVALMHVTDTGGLLHVLVGCGLLAGLLMLPWRRLAAIGSAAVAAACIGGVVVAVVLVRPYAPVVSEYKWLSYARRAGAEITHHGEDPLGRLDVAAGRGIHYHPGLSDQFGLTADPHIPSHVLLITDGDQVSPVYDCRSREDWRFMDWTTPAVAYALRPRPRVLILGTGGGSDIGLAMYHRCPRVVGLEMNPQVTAAMTGPLADRGGAVYHAPGVTVVNQEARGYLSGAAERFDVIQLPAIGAFGTAGAGVQSTQEAFLYTVESIGAMLDRLTDGGLLCITCTAAEPPRHGLRILDTAAEALRRRRLAPSPRLALIRMHATVTVLAARAPLGEQDLQRIRAFCDERGFDLGYLPDLAAPASRPYHALHEPYYFHGARALLGPGRKAFLAEYRAKMGFDVSATTDDRPFFFHFGSPGPEQLAEPAAGADNRLRAFAEQGVLMMAAALVQAAAAGVVLIVLPLAFGIKALYRARRKAATLGYFLALGVGFMLLEMGFLAKLILYLAHPIYSAAVVICAFLLFAGIGSQLSGRWRGPPRLVGTIAAAAVVAMAAVLLFVLDGWLALTQAAPLAVRFGIAAATIAPLAFAMGHLMPTGLRQIGVSAPALVPWAWAVNGFASVGATVAAPLIAMHLGFSRLTWMAIVCYAAAAALVNLLPTPQHAATRSPAGRG